MNKEIISKISEAIRFAKDEQNFILISEDWGAEKLKCACAIGCLLLKNKKSFGSDSDKAEEVAAELLGVDSKWVDAFINGFDNTPFITSWVTDYPDLLKILNDGFETGTKVKDEFKPMAFHIFQKSFMISCQENHRPCGGG